MENKDQWKHELTKLVDFHKLFVPRICIPFDKDLISGNIETIICEPLTLRREIVGLGKISVYLCVPCP